MRSISSGHFSHDAQVSDAMSYLESEHPDVFATLVREFPEWERHTYELGGAWFDTHAMGVDPEWSSWLADAIESTGLVIWEDGEPYALEPVDLSPNPYAEGLLPIPDPGGYRLVVVMDDGDTLCETCLRDITNPCHPADDANRDGWGVVGFDTTGTSDEDLFCAHHGGII